MPYVLVVKSSMAAFHTHARARTHTHTHTQPNHLASTAPPPGDTGPVPHALDRALSSRSGGRSQSEGTDGGMVRLLGFLHYTWRDSELHKQALNKAEKMIEKKNNYEKC